MNNFDTTKWFKNQYIQEHLINESISLFLKDLTFDDVVNAFNDDYQNVQFTRKQPNGEEGNYYKDSVSFPNPDDSLTRVGDMSSFEGWKEKTLSRYGNIKINLAPEADVWFNKVKVIDDKFNNDKKDYVDAKGKAMADWSKKGYSIDEAATKNLYVPRVVKDKNNPNFINVYIDYDLGPGGAAIALGKETMTGQMRREGALRAMQIANDVVTKLNTEYNVEDYEIVDLENGKVRVFAVSDDFENAEFKGGFLNEMDLDRSFEDVFGKEEAERRMRKQVGGVNDPVLVKTRADRAKMDKLEKDQEQKIQNLKRTGAKETPLRKLANMGKIAFLEKEREQLMRDMEQEAEPEGGPIADEYGRKLNRIDKSIAKLSGRKEMTYDQAIAEGEGKMPTQDQVDKFFALTQNEMHYLNSKPDMSSASAIA